MNWLRRYLRNLINSAPQPVEAAGYTERGAHDRVSVEVDTASNGYVINVVKYSNDHGRNASIRHDSPIRELWVCKDKTELDETIRTALVSIKLKGG